MKYKDPITKQIICTEETFENFAERVTIFLEKMDEETYNKMVENILCEMNIKTKEYVESGLISHRNIVKL